jgi:large-conductance mechanosensitive channel
VAISPRNRVAAFFGNLLTNSISGFIIVSTAIELYMCNFNELRDQQEARAKGEDARGAFYKTDRALAKMSEIRKKSRVTY